MHIQVELGRVIAGFMNFGMLITAAVIYWITSFCFELIQARIEAYYGKGGVR